MSDPELQELAMKLDDLLKEVRRQGRAAIAAQAAAESCLEAIEARETEPSMPIEASAETSDEAVRWLRALVPVADAIDRMAQRAGAVEAPDAPPKRTLLQRFFGAGEPDDRHDRAALAEGLRVLRAQLEGTLHDLGVAVDRRTGDPVDAERQRVVEVRAPRPHEREGTVVEVVRPGYALGPKIVREAEVVIAAGSEQ
ncbi:MAG: nucleotide exchange factor GrpE [Byssovorax sp.]